MLTFKQLIFNQKSNYRLSKEVITSLSRIPSQFFQSLDWRWRLLLVYLTAMAAIFGTSSAALYVFFARSLNQQLNEQLLTLAQAADPSLATIQTEGRQTLSRDLPWRNLFSRREQSLEWYNADGELLAREGTLFPPFPLVKNVSASPSGLSQGSPIFEKADQIISVTIAVYAEELEEKTLRLKGYIRASQSTEQLQVTLNQLLVGLELGGITALILISLSGVYLTQQALEPMKQSFKRLQQFTADVSHELRNPLSSIGMATELMLCHREQMQPSDVKKLEMIDSAAAQMKRLVEDLRFLSRTDAGATTVQERLTISLDELLRALAEQFEPIAQLKGITFQAKLPAGLSVKGDVNQLSRLFSNLLENALKYTEAGGSVTLSLGKSRGNAVISVTDTGIGIAAEYLPFVFQRFWRSEQARSQQQEGLGLGLAIAQAIAQQHGGEITVSSKVGVGSCFRGRLPLV